MIGAQHLMRYRPKTTGEAAKLHLIYLVLGPEAQIQSSLDDCEEPHAGAKCCQ